MPETAPTEDDVLRKMLRTPPKPHKPLKESTEREVQDNTAKGCKGE